MITSWDIYWITRLDNITALAVGATIVLSVVFVLSGIFIPMASDCFDISENVWKLIKRIFKVLITIWCISVFVNAACPTSKELVAIMFVPKIANNEQLQQVPENALKLINSKLKEWVADIEGEKKK